MTATREELARLIDPYPMSDAAKALALYIADRILARFKLVSKYSVVVPVEPTAEMATAGAEATADFTRNEVRKFYRAMLAARPGASHE